MSSEQGSPSVLPTLTGAETQERPLQGGDGELSFPVLTSPLFFPQLTVGSFWFFCYRIHIPGRKGLPKSHGPTLPLPALK